MPDFLRKIIFSALFCSLAISHSSAQSFKAFEKAGDKALDNKDYYAALHYYGQALEQRTDDPGGAYKYAEGARHFNAFETAIEYYQIAGDKSSGKTFPDLQYWLGICHKNLGDYELAKQHFQAYTGSRFVNEAKAEIQSCDWALELLQHPDPYKIEKLNKRVNTAYSEFGALQRGDTLYYSSYRFEKKNDKNIPPRKITKILSSVKGAKGRPLRRSFNDEEKHTAHTAFSLDGKRIYFTKCDFVNASDIRCAIYYRDKDRRRRWNKTAVKLPVQVNKPGYTATHPHIGFDSGKGKQVLFFVSDRPGGSGGLDIWRSELDQKGKFLEPQPLSSVNTPDNDINPFLDIKSQILFFSSDGRQGLGGYDIFKWDGKQISHMGTPLNSSYNDVYFTVDTTLKTGYLSSNRPGAFYLDAANKACCNDIYRFEWIEPKSLDSTEIAEIPSLPVESTITNEPQPMPTKLEDFLPLALYFDNDEPDKRTRRTVTKKTYEETFLKYYKNKSTYLAEFVKPLNEEDKAEAELVVDSFFEEEVKRGYDFLFRFSEILLERLEAGEEVEIFIKGYTSPRAKSDYNLHLGQRRISSLRNHFDAYQDGVFLEFLKKGQLKITERSFGESQASNLVSDELEDVRNSVYSPDAAKERRVEIVEIKRGE